MIGKLLLAVLITGILILYIRRQRRAAAERAGTGGTANPSAAMPARRGDSAALEQFLNRARQTGDPASGNPADQGALAPRIRFVLWMILLALLLTAGIGSFLYWQDQQRLVTVLLHRDASEAPVIYRVAKRNLGSNSFTTNDGTVVTVSANERMEVVGL